MSNENRTGLSPFATLLRGWAPSGRKAEEQNNGGDDEEARKARRAEEDQQREEEDARRAEEDQRRQDEDARRAEEEGGGAKQPEGKKADGDDQDPEADDADGDADAEDGMDDKEKAAFQSGIALGRSRELTRCARIFGHELAVANPAGAVTLAFTTRNSSAAAGRLLASFGKPQSRGRSLDERMAVRTDARPGADTAAGSGGKGGTLASKMIAVGERLGQIAKS